MSFTKMTAQEAAALIQHGDTIGFSGFTAAGSPTSIPTALGDKAARSHQRGEPFQVGVITGASTHDQLDGALARAEAISFRTPYQSDPTLRRLINTGKSRFFDMHLSMLPQAVRYGFLGSMQWAIVEAAEVLSGGGIVLTTAVGAAPTFCTSAEKILIEINRFHPPSLLGFHDVYEPENPPNRRDIPVYGARDRIGSPVIKVDPSKIVGVVETNFELAGANFEPATAQTDRIGENVAEFLAAELRSGRIPKDFLPVQSGVGNTQNSVLGALGDHPEIPNFDMYTEVVQDSVIGLMQRDRVRFASTCSLTVSRNLLREIYADLEWCRPRLLLRPQEISNNPEVIRRLGLIAINTAIEVDLFGNVNSTHVMGKQMMNGIGGSADFTRNAYLSIFVCPSAVKGNAISTVVPMVAHVDQSEHSVQVIVTEQGVADLRGKDPHERARLIIENCAHPDYREQLYGYLETVRDGHSPFTLSAAYAMHQHFLRTGTMRDVDWKGLISKG
jgi:acetyl-CoA hydrolase